MLVRLPYTDVLLLSCYVRPNSGNAPLLQLGWFAYLHRMYLGYSMLVNWDVKMADEAWRFPLLACVQYHVGHVH